MTVFEGITREQRKQLPVPTQELPLIQHTSSARWHCVTSLKRRFDLSGIWRKATHRKNRTQKESESCCEVTFKEMPPCHRITVLKWLLGEEVAILLFFKMQSNGFWARVEKPFQHEVRGLCLQRIVFPASEFPAWWCYVMVRPELCPEKPAATSAFKNHHTF